MRSFLTAVAIALLAVPTGAVADAPADKKPPKIDERTKQAIDKALRYLKDQQSSDGAWKNTAITGFTLLAFMSNGNLPNQGQYGPEVAKGVRFLLSEARNDGYLLGPRDNPGQGMYHHGMATLALSQVYGMTGDEEVRKVLHKAIDMIIRSQNRDGAWRYRPDANDSDVSITIMQVMALRGAKDSGLQVPDNVMTKALAYIGRCRDPRTGGYRYQAFSPGVGYARTAAGVCVLQLCGEYDAKEIAAAVKYLQREGNDRGHYWYGHYYAAHAFHQLGGKLWEDYYTNIRNVLLAKQRPNGEWNDGSERIFGTEYQTAVAVLVLSVPTHYLPIYQR